MPRTRSKGVAATATTTDKTKTTTTSKTSSIHTLPAASSKPPKLFILPKTATLSARVVTLQNPRTNKPARYLICPETGFFEFTHISPPKSTLEAGSSNPPPPQSQPAVPNNKKPTSPPPLPLPRHPYDPSSCSSLEEGWGGVGSGMAASEEVVRLQRLRVAFNFICSRYVAPGIAAMLKESLGKATELIDFAPLDDYLARLAKMRQEAAAAR
ncbi:hypothetical protein N0V88_005405 [Collariella sp. IMI 366227]|nr:hypothetical protein N0V88_005405 [Collariella sp. IMI 366227]